MIQTAPLKKRFLALFFEYLTILCYMVVLFGISMFFYFVVLDGIPKFSELEMNLISLALLGPVILYSIIMEWGKNHATLGKMKMKLVVETTRLKPIKLWQIVIRNIIKFLPWQLAHIVIFHSFTLEGEFTPFWSIIMIIVNILPFVWIGFLFRKDHRGIHDLIAKTVVVDFSDDAHS